MTRGFAFEGRPVKTTFMSQKKDAARKGAHRLILRSAQDNGSVGSRGKEMKSLVASHN